MLWVFLFSINFLFILCLWHYCGSQIFFYNFISPPSSFYRIFVYNQTLTYCQFVDGGYSLGSTIISLIPALMFLMELPTTLSQQVLYFNFSFVVLFAFYQILVFIQLITYIFYFNAFFWTTCFPLNVFFSESGVTYNWESFFISANSYNYISTNPLLVSLTPIQHLFILLTVFLTPLALLSNWNDLKYQFFNIKSFLLLLLLLLLLLIICFSTFNLFLFILMFESTTIPLFLLISLFGHRAKKYRAAWYLFLYTLLGSIFMLGAVLLIYYQYQTVNLVEIFFNYQFKNISSDRLKLIWLGLFLGFAIKVPIAPFHMWLPEAHVEAPTAGSILLAGILLKLGGYGIIFFLLPFFPLTYFLPLVYTLCIISMFYSSFILFRETHLKKIIAYSSIVHMNIGILGLFSNSLVGVMGGLFMMFSHGFISGGLFFCGGILFNRFKSYDITTIKNLSTTMPKFSFLFIVLIFGNMGLPLTSGFIGEFLVLYGAINIIILLLLVYCLLSC